MTKRTEYQETRLSRELGYRKKVRILFSTHIEEVFKPIPPKEFELYEAEIVELQIGRRLPADAEAEE